MIQTLAQQPRRRILRRLSIALLVVLTIAYSLANLAARLVLESQLSAALQCDVSIGSVRVGWPELCMHDIHMSVDSASAEPLVHVSSIIISLTPGDGFRRGVWADKVVVATPTLTVNVSESGELLTELPEYPSGGDGPVPLRLLKIVGGAVEVKQSGGKTFRVDDAGAVVAFGERVRLVAVLPEFFGGKVCIKGDLDAKAFSGDIRIAAEGLETSSAKLRSLPVICTHIPDTRSDGSALNDFSASGSLTGSIAVPPNPGGPLGCAAEAELRVDILDFPGRGVRADNMIVRLSHQAGGPTALVADSGLFGGSVHLDGEFRFAETVGDTKQSVHGHVNCSVDHVPLGPIAKRLNLPGALSAELNASGTVTASVLKNQIRLDGTLNSDASKINFFGHRSDPLVVQAAVSGDMHLIDGELQPSSGAIRLSAGLNGIDVKGVLEGIVPLLQSAPIEPELRPLIQRLQSWGSGGRVSFSAELNAPLDAVNDVRLVTSSGRLVGEKLAIGGLVIANVNTSFGVQNGTVYLQLPETPVMDLVAQQAATLSGRCTLPLTSAGQATAELGIGNFSLVSAANLAGLPPQHLSGKVSVWMKAAAPVEQLCDFAFWQGQGIVSSPLIIVHGEPVSDCLVPWTLSNSQVHVQRASARWNQATLTAQATGEIVAPFRFTGTAAAGDVDLSEVSRLAEAVAGTGCDASGLAAITGSVVGDGASMNYQCRGDIVLQNVVVGGKTLGTHRIRCSLSPTLLHVEEADAGFFGGNAALTATLRRGAAPVRHITAQIQNVQVASLRDLLAIRGMAGGAINGELVIVEPMLPDQLTGQLKFQSRDMHVAGIPVETFNTSLVAQAGEILTSVNVRGIGASFQVVAQTAISDLMTISPEILHDPRQLPVFGQITLTGLSVERVRRALAALPGRARLPKQLSGMLDLQLNRSRDTANAGVLLSGDATLRNVLWNQVQLSKEAVARLQITPTAVELRELVGTFADGRLSGRGVVTLAEIPDGQFRLSVSGMNIRKVAEPVRELVGTVAGVADLQIEGRLGRRMSGRALLSVDRASVNGVSFTHARFPIDWSVVPSTRDIHITCDSIAMNVGGGRVHGQATARWNGRLDLNASAIAQHVDTRKLMENGGGAGGGTLDGSVHLRARGARSIDDVSGRFQGTLKDAQAMKLPVLDQASRLLGSLSRSTSFKDGTIKGRLAHGVVTLEQLNLMASNVRIVMDGTATMRGNLNLFVSAYISEAGPADKILDFANSPIMLAAPAPVAVVARINDALKDRTIHVNVGGTIGQPLVRLQPGRQLQQEALRFLVNSSLNFSPIRTVGYTR